jgi:D-galactarolactone cycloisomerase
MNRRTFMTNLSCGVAGAATLINSPLLSAPVRREQYPELAKHRIDKADVITIDYHWPRFVGRNGTKDFHGQHHKTKVLRLRTDQGAQGWGMCDQRPNDSLADIIGKPVVDLITPETGTLPGYNTFYYDLAFFDLLGVIMYKPVYQILGAKGPKSMPVYSGMIYIDEMPSPVSKEGGGMETILQNCAWDFNYGYRQLKIKIGRSGKWYPPKEGMEMDIKVVNTVYQEYRDKGVQLLVDSNNAYNLNDTTTFLDGIRGVPLFWVEEPFPEKIDDGKKLREWMDKNGFQNTRYADGEWIWPDQEDVALEMVKQRTVNTYLNDVHAYGITNWMKVMPVLKKAGADGSPHAWGDRLKTHYTAHIAAGLGNISTVEGVTTFSDDVDYGHYHIKDGQITVSDEPGFGMKLLKMG